MNIMQIPFCYLSNAEKYACTMRIQFVMYLMPRTRREQWVIPGITIEVYSDQGFSNEFAGRLFVCDHNGIVHAWRHFVLVVYKIIQAEISP